MVFTLLNVKPYAMKNSTTVRTLNSVEDLNRKEEANFEASIDADFTPLTDGDDAIEMESNEADKIIYGATFSGADGDLGDESEDRGDLPYSVNENGYNPSLPEMQVQSLEDELELNNMHISNEQDAGIAYDDNDYTKP
jgi:hypothetical protein